MRCQSESGAAAWAVAREYLGWRGPGERSLRLQGVGHGLVGQRGGEGGERGGERDALHDPIVITIVDKVIIHMRLFPPFAHAHHTAQAMRRRGAAGGMLRHNAMAQPSTDGIV